MFGYEEGDIFACVSDLGWIAAHTYVVYGPLCNGGTSVLFEGTATYPSSGELALANYYPFKHFVSIPWNRSILHVLFVMEYIAKLWHVWHDSQYSKVIHGRIFNKTF